MRSPCERLSWPSRFAVQASAAAFSFLRGSAHRRGFPAALAVAPELEQLTPIPAPPMHNELQMGGILGGLLGTLALCAIVFVVVLALAYVHWVFSGGFMRWHRARQDRLEAAEIEAED